ncbi:MAG: transglycosylase SLT domain-containing protein [bacterium]|jgi:soluble lytic murein transglycosylase-like protein
MRKRLLLLMVGIMPAVAAANYIEASVTRVHSPSRFTLVINGQSVEANLTGLEVPRNCHEFAALRWAQALLPPGSTVLFLRSGAEQRMLTFAGAELRDYTMLAINAGAASRLATSENPDHFQAEADAKQARRGLWAECRDESMFVLVGREQNITPRLLYAIALTESGRAGVPHPWTLNVEGDAHYFPTRQAAHDALVAFLKQGKRSIDVGYMQVNLRHHPHVFKNTWEALDPLSNIRAGARILQEKYARVGSDKLAIAHYHNANPEKGIPYLGRVAKNYQRVTRDTLARPSTQY